MIRFFFLFKQRWDGASAQIILEQQGFAPVSYFHLSELETPLWSLTVEREYSSDEFMKMMDEIESTLEKIAGDCNGSYDGHEFDLSSDS